MSPPPPAPPHPPYTPYSRRLDRRQRTLLFNHQWLPLNCPVVPHPPVNGLPDCAAWAVNLSSVISAHPSSASSYFLSISISRTGSHRAHSLLDTTSPTIGKYDSRHCHTGERVRGNAFYGVRSRFIWGVALPLDAGRSNSGLVFPIVVVDLVAPLLLTSSVGNAIFWAIWDFLGWSGW